MLNRPSIDLEGKTVSIDLPNGGTLVTALTVVERLGIKANFVYRQLQLNATVYLVQGAPQSLTGLNPQRTLILHIALWATP